MNKQIKRIAISALLVALGVVFSRFLSFPIYLAGNYSINIGFGILPILLLCALYGPIYGCIGAMCWDMLGALLFPFGPFVIWFTLAAGVYGAVAGSFFAKARLEHVFDDSLGDASIFTIYHYAKPITTKRLALATGTGQLIYSVMLNTLLISLLYGKPFFKITLVFRLLENVVMMGLNTLIANALIGIIKKTSIISERFGVAADAPQQEPEQLPEEVEENYGELLGQVGGYICNSNFDKAIEIYETLMLAYRRDPDIFTANQKREFVEYKREIAKNCPDYNFVIVEPAFDIENELGILRRFVNAGDSQKAANQLSRINTYYATNPIMFNAAQKAKLDELSGKIR